MKTKQFIARMLVCSVTLLGSTNLVAKVKVGVFNIVPEQILNWDEFHLAGKVTVQDMKKAVEKR